MKNIDLDQAFHQTPSSFSQRMDETLDSLKEQRPVKKVAVRTIAIATLITLLLCSVAYGVITQGIQWYYNNRMELSPQMYDVVMNNIQTNLEQQDANNQYISVTVKEVAWLPEEKVLTVLLLATAKDPANVELHPMWNLDADGSYAGPDPANLREEEDRIDHWLWTEKGHGPIGKTMDDPSKKLILFEADYIWIVSLEDEQVMLPLSIFGSGVAMDALVGEDGSTIVVLDMPLDYLAEDDFEGAGMEQRFLEAREVLDKNTDENGMLTLCIPYVVTEYVADDDMALYTGGTMETLTCKIKVK